MSPLTVVSVQKIIVFGEHPADLVDVASSSQDSGCRVISSVTNDRLVDARSSHPFRNDRFGLCVKVVVLGPSRK